MKDSGTCPKCQGSALIRLHGQGGPHGNGISIGLRVVPITRYVCHTCGFSEEWIESRGDLDRLRDRFGYAADDPTVPPPGVSIHSQLGLS